MNRVALRAHGVLLSGLLWACSSAPLPADLSRGQQLEAQRRDDEALVAYRTGREGCRYAGARARDDCGLLAFREGQVLERLGRIEEAKAAFLRTRELTVDGRLAGRALVRAALLCAEQLKQKDQALALCRLVIGRWPDEVPAEDALRLLCQVQGDDPGLPAELDRIASDLRDHEVSGFALLYRAERAERDGQSQVAVDRYDELWRRFPRGPLRDDAAYKAALLLRKLLRPEQAAEHLVRLEKTFRSSLVVGHYKTLLLDDAALLLGQIYLSDLHRFDQAIQALKGLLKRQPNSLLCDDALYLMAQAALGRHALPLPGDRAEACGYLRQLRERYPDGNMVRRAARDEERLGCRGK